MNLLLLETHELSANGAVTLGGRRAQHAFEVLRVTGGDSVRVGVRGGQIGQAVVTASSKTELSLTVTLSEAPPARPNVDVVLAIPRPKALKRVIPALASFGVDRVFLVNAARVEKSYFDSKVLTAEFINELVTLGLEQGCDTIAPTFELRERFKPFVEDELPALLTKATLLVPHPHAVQPLSPLPLSQRVIIAIGPDGGWVPFELDCFARVGGVGVRLGPRILRGEVAVSAVLGALRSTSW